MDIEMPLQKYQQYQFNIINLSIFKNPRKNTILKLLVTTWCFLKNQSVHS